MRTLFGLPLIGALLLLGTLGTTNITLAQTTWSTNALEHRGKNGQRFTYTCPPNGKPGSVSGTDIYTDDSSICTAAVHAGLITFASGGTVTIEIRPGRASYIGSRRNGVASGYWDSWPGSFVFVTPEPKRVYVIPPEPPITAERVKENRPPNPPTPISPPNTWDKWSPAIDPSSVTFRWIDNGDPDGDPVSFYINVFRYDPSSQKWTLTYNDWVRGTSVTLKNLEPGSYYGWRVYAIDQGQHSDPWYAESEKSGFYTMPIPGGGDTGKMEYNVDLSGAVLRYFSLSEPRPELCQTACAEDTNCRAFTYVKPGMSPGNRGAAMCYLKSSVSQRIQDSCCISGVK
ncbi:MAG TPA: LCCL domain-containing protein [Thermodesulfobacteriota bacterium]|nr:LCCL domain-containing protein [Thermodesulfobacteriota bacterium]